mgnify:CR=1 FL=1
MNRKHNIINTLSFKGNDLLLTFFVKHCPIVQIMWWSKHYIYQEPQFGIHWYKSDPLSIIWWNMTTNVMAASIGDNKTYLSISFFLLKCPSTSSSRKTKRYHFMSECWFSLPQNASIFCKKNPWAYLVRSANVMMKHKNDKKYQTSAMAHQNYNRVSIPHSKGWRSSKPICEYQ